MSLYSMMSGDTITVKRATESQNAEGFATESYANATGLVDIAARVYPLSAREAERYGKLSNQEKAFGVLLEGDIDIRPTDEIVYDWKQWHVVEVITDTKTPDGRMRYTKAIIEESVNV